MKVTLLHVWGGDEFAAILPTIQSPESAAQVARKIIEDLSRTFFIQHYKIHIGASIGISLYPGEHNTLEDIVQNADSAMYLAKQKGGSQLSFYNETFSHQVERHLLLE